MNRLQELEARLEELRRNYRNHPESAEVFAEEIMRLEEYLEMCYDTLKVHEILEK